jgi:hypothetical protein
MYKRPTAASTMIYFVSNHPMEQKMAASRYMLHRIYDLPLTEEKQNKNKMRTVIDLTNVNCISAHLIHKLGNKFKNKET